MPILVDSSVWIDYFNGRPTPQTDHLDRILGEDLLALGDLIVAEVLQGFRHERHWRAAKDALLRLPVLRIGGLDLALQSASNYRTLRARGVTVRKTIDCLIATFCIEEGIELLHADRDFVPFARHLGLRESIPSASAPLDSSG